MGHVVNKVEEFMPQEWATLLVNTLDAIGSDRNRMKLPKMERAAIPQKFTVTPELRMLFPTEGEQENEVRSALLITAILLVCTSTIPPLVLLLVVVWLSVPIASSFAGG